MPFIHVEKWWKENIITNKYVKICNEIAKEKAIHHSHWRK